MPSLLAELVGNWTGQVAMDTGSRSLVCYSPLVVGSLLASYVAMLSNPAEFAPKAALSGGSVKGA